MLDIGNENLFSDIKQRIEADDFSDFDPGATMQQANRQFADEFTPQFRQFIHTVLDANGAPVIWHCTAGKDRTGFAAAILLRVLGCPGHCDTGLYGQQGARTGVAQISC